MNRHPRMLEEIQIRLDYIAEDLGVEQDPWDRVSPDTLSAYERGYSTIAIAGALLARVNDNRRQTRLLSWLVFALTVGNYAIAKGWL